MNLGMTVSQEPTTSSSAPASPATPNSPSTVRNSHAWLGPLQTYALRCSTDGETYGRFLRETVLPQLEKLREDLKIRGKAIKVRLLEIQTRLAKQHETLSSAMSSHEKGWRVRAKIGLVTPKEGEDEALAESLSGTDIFITEQQLRHRVGLFLEEKQYYIAVLIDVFNKARQLEHEFASALKGILGEAMRVKGQQLTAAAEQTNDCATATRTSEALVEWNNALRRCRLDWDWQVEAPPLDGFLASALTQIGCNLSTSEMEPTVKSVRIVKSGFLMRPSTFGRSWNVMFCLLVDSGFLHCYSPDAVTAKDISAETTSHAKSYRIPSPSMRLHGKALLELNQAANRVWLSNDSRPQTPGPMEAIVSRALVQPILSIPLLHPETAISPDPKAGSHAFAITIPGGASFFSRSERRHVLSSFVEEDMVDWCIALKEELGGTPVEISRPSSRASSEIGSTRPIESKAHGGLGAHGAFGTSASTYSTDQLEFGAEADFDANDYRRRSSLDNGGETEIIARTTTPAAPELENPWD